MALFRTVLNHSFVTCEGSIGILLILRPLLAITLLAALFDDRILKFATRSKIFIPFFNLTNLDKYVTLKELYKITNVEFNIYTTNFTLLKLEVINYKNNPDLSVVKRQFQVFKLRLKCNILAKH